MDIWMGIFPKKASLLQAGDNLQIIEKRLVSKEMNSYCLATLMLTLVDNLISL
jgi:hypothetical protein